VFAQEATRTTILWTLAFMVHLRSLLCHSGFFAQLSIARCGTV
jgi:hypothetical protein